MQLSKYLLFSIWVFIFLLQFCSLPSMAMKLSNWTLYILKVKCDNSSTWMYLPPTIGKINCGDNSGITITRGKETGKCVEVSPDTATQSRLINLHKHCVHMPKLGECVGTLPESPTNSASANGFPTAIYFWGLGTANLGCLRWYTFS